MAITFSATMEEIFFSTKIAGAGKFYCGIMDMFSPAEVFLLSFCCLPAAGALISRFAHAIQTNNLVNTAIG
jgi:hypothetical protein